MPLYIKDPTVDSLVDRYLALTGMTNKTEAVRQALKAAIAAQAERETLAERVAKVQRKAAAVGIVADGHDDKALMDEMWGEE